MASFSSSVINKSGKKFAPKIPARRAPAASVTPAAPPRDANSRASQTPQPAAPVKESTPTQPPTKSPSSPTVKPPEPPKPRSPNLSPQLQTRRSPVAPRAVRIPLPLQRPPVPTTTRSEVSVSQSQAQGPVTTEPNKEPPPLITLPTPGPQAGPSSQVLRPTASPEPRTTQTEPESNTRPAKRIRVSDPETRIPLPSRRDSRDQTAIPTPAASTRQSVDVTSHDETSTTTTKKTSKRETVRPKRKRIAEDEAAVVAENAVRTRKPRSRRKREPTPEDAESIEIMSAVVKMSDLCKDLRTGRKSRREMELRNMEAAELTKKKTERGEKSASQQPQQDPREKTPGSGKGRGVDEELQASGPQMRLVNGEIVLDTASLQIDRHADAARNAEDMEEVEENPLTRRINQASFGKKTKHEAWDEEMTDLFYRGLRMFGTDFMMISKMFPGRTRRHIKLKFCNEERKAPERIKETLLGPREVVDLDDYSEMTNTVYDDPKGMGM
ncbi:conserved hypothetical protein [Uncinocarpus reesii 1704]|uniref:Myb-like domain-containing protein n=1 Tax=Uncinocarpus reesii (strain UAMH 1704) TaxID=336963 RepID=C4JP20_UNCRE|nr:uncharacterized protein UREG_03079 [Uncinocarpus reesii 1704]EEP78234.1 conserved hypothetical protein [Uncinocarpus reesii 1704]